LIFSDAVEDGVPLALVHGVGGNNITSLNTSAN
jgi:hypothetical protein